jgi:hypothetical protein
MWKLLLINVTLLLTTTVYGQKVSSIELDFIGRYDKHADYTTRFGDRSYTNDTKLWGKSFGFNINYIHSLYKHINAKIGIGYYNLGIDKIRQTTPFNIIATGRNINYRHPSGILPLFGTNKYHYDDLSFTLDLAYERPIAKKVNFIAGGGFNYLYTFSQLYHITYDNIRYRTNNGKTLGFAANTYFGLLRKFYTKYYLSPKIVVPIYQQLGGDEAFGEDRSVKMEKWFDGVGLSLSVGKYL